MKSKEKALFILDEYLRREYNIDHQHKNLKANRVVIYEGQYWWELHASDEGTEYSTDSVGQIGGYTYFVTKDTGDIYQVSFFQRLEWQDEYIQFKLGKKAVFNWEKARNLHLDCELLEETDHRINPFFKEIPFDTRTERTQQILDKLILSSDRDHTLTPCFKYIPIDGIKSKLELWNFENINIEEFNKLPLKNVVSLKFQGGYQKMNATLANLKKWVRVNDFQITDNYWISVEEMNTSKNFEEWNLIMKMEFIIRPYPK